jgi:hypothetical protein
VGPEEVGDTGFSKEQETKMTVSLFLFTGMDMMPLASTAALNPQICMIHQSERLGSEIRYGLRRLR